MILHSATRCFSKLAAVIHLAITWRSEDRNPDVHATGHFRRILAPKRPHKVEGGEDVDDMEQVFEIGVGILAVVDEIDPYTM